ncbi:PREDICTED: aminoacylase-1A-like [Papilio polytes]|uniref:aminoacylase-1A-like n=1 Tax=Papilio polytes TaxID=76194 RepID=UPI000676A5BC|nr:PREDICTED: aminoacylase-1A-like [Papilio polytes]
MKIQIFKIKTIYAVLILLWIVLGNVEGRRNVLKYKECDCNPDVHLLQDYISINTSPGRDLRPAVDFLKRLGETQNIEVTVYEAKPNYPVVVFKWPGRDPNRRSILLLSHMDVVPACYEDGWTYDPFSGEINDECEIVGRGTQDMKSFTIQYFLALKNLKENNVTLLRNVYMVVTPDGAAGSENGIALFVKSKAYKDLNVGFVLDRSIPNPNNQIFILNSDKTTIVFRIDCYNPSTSSAFLVNINVTAYGTCSKFFKSYEEYREEQYKILLKTGNPGAFTAINFVGDRTLLTYSTIPAHVAAFYTVYLAQNTSVANFNKIIRSWAYEAGRNVTVSVVYEKNRVYATKADRSNPYWVAISETFNDLNIPINQTSGYTTTDITFVIETGVPGFGITPQRNTPILVNGINERLSIPIFFEGIKIYERILRRIANLRDDQVNDDPTVYLIKPRPAVDFWRRLAEEQGIEIKVYECVPGYPLIVLKWPGSDPSLSSILLLSHMDVEPANYKVYGF